MERKWWTLIVVCVATFMLLLDITIVNVALPKMASDLHASFSDIQWVIDAYSLMLASVLLTAGTLADQLGRRLLFSIGLGLFSLASLLCALSPSALFLIIARGFQGIGGSMMFATSLALLAQEFHGRERGTAFGAWGATIAASAAVGPLLGGFLTEDLGWSSIFYINVPVGIAGVVLALAKVAETRNPEARKIDWFGTATFTTSLFLGVLAIIRGNAEGWGSAFIVGLFAASAALLVAFVIAQVRLRNAMFDVSLFRKPTFDGASIVAFGLSAAMFAMFLFIVLYIQTILGYSPLETGLRFLPFTVVSFFLAALSGRLTDRIPARVLLGVGMLMVGVGLLLMRGLTPQSDWTAMLAGFIIAGGGVGVINPALASTSIGVVPPQRSGMASGINNTFRQVGTATGIAVLGAVFEHVIASKLTPKLAGTPAAGHAAQIAHAVAAGGAQQVVHAVPPGQRMQAALAIRSAFAASMNDILLVGAIVALVGAVFAFLLVRGSDFVTYATPEAAPAPSA
jgi:EmrB/QacA subfamily drug resistance transporter